MSDLDIIAPNTRAQTAFNKIELLKTTIKEKNEELKEEMEGDSKIQEVDKEIYELDQTMLALKTKRKDHVDDFKTKHFKEYEAIGDMKLKSEVEKEGLVDLVLANNREGKETEVFKELDGGKKVRIAIGFKPVFKKVKSEKQGRGNE